MVTDSRVTLKRLSEDYLANGKVPIAFDFKKEFLAMNVNTINDSRQFHYLHYYPGKIYPYIPLFLLSLEDLKHLNGYVLDAFAGSGTVLLESIINPIIRRRALGVDINPLARLIAKVKVTPLNLEQIDSSLASIKQAYSKKINFQDSIPNFKRIDIWFSESAKKSLARLRYAIDKLDAPADYRDFFWVCFSSIIRKSSRADPFIPPPVLLKAYKYGKSSSKYAKVTSFLETAENPDTWGLFEDAVRKNKVKLGAIRKSISNDCRCEIIWDDVANIKKGKLTERGRIEKDGAEAILPGSIDIIFTSPPYLTAQKYIRASKLELYWLGYSEEEVNDLDKSSLGTERVSKKSVIGKLDVKPIDSLVSYAYKKNPKRGLTVYAYFNRMKKILNQLYPLLKNGGYAFFVVGDNRVLNKKVDTYLMLSEIAQSIGFKEKAILKDTIKTRSMMTKRNGTGGLITHEYVVILKKGME